MVLANSAGSPGGAELFSQVNVGPQIDTENRIFIFCRGVVGAVEHQRRSAHGCLGPSSETREPGLLVVTSVRRRWSGKGEGPTLLCLDVLLYTFHSVVVVGIFLHGSSWNARDVLGGASNPVGKNSINSVPTVDNGVPVSSFGDMDGSRRVSRLEVRGVLPGFLGCFGRGSGRGLDWRGSWTGMLIQFKSPETSLKLLAKGTSKLGDEKVEVVVGSELRPPIRGGFHRGRARMGSRSPSGMSALEDAFICGRWGAGERKESESLRAGADFRFVLCLEGGLSSASESSLSERSSSESEELSTKPAAAASTPARRSRCSSLA